IGGVGGLDAAEQDLDHGVPLLALARSVLDQGECVARLGTLVATFAKQRDPALDVIGIGARLRQRDGCLLAPLAQRLEPLGDAALGSLIATAALEVDDLD